MIIYDNQLSKMKLFSCRGIFSEILIPKMSTKMNLRIITKSYRADPEIGFLRKTILHTFESESIPTACDFS